MMHIAFFCLGCLVSFAAAGCWTDTSGTCNILGCNAYRGPTECKRFGMLDHRCICQPGTCVSRGGTCIPEAAFNETMEADCDSVTGGTCHFFGCKAFRGNTTCEHGHCLCNTGYCQHGGVCRVEKEEKSTPNKPFCTRKTGATCHVRDCPSWRGETYCSDGGCKCKYGSCATNGVCYKDQGTLEANIARVNAKERKFPGNQGNIKTALCLSGGGARALTASMGILRALENLDLMKNVDAISTCSGGSWAGGIYMFATLEIEKLLGKPTDPSQLTMEELKKKPGALGDVITHATAEVGADLFFKGVDYPNFWMRFVAQLMLRPFDLDCTDCYMAADQEAVTRIKAANPKLANERFLVPQAGRPKTWVALGVLVAPAGYVASEDSLVSFQMSPDYVGSPFYPNQDVVNYQPLPMQSWPALEGLLVGGGLVESFAFGGKNPPSTQTGDQGKTMAAPAEPFSLAKAVGISSNGPASTFTQQKVQQSLTALNALTEYWPVLSPQQPGPQRSMTYQLGDGGNMDNSAVLQMLQRGAEKIISVTSADLPLPEPSRIDFCTVKTVDEMETWVEANKDKPGELEWTLRASFGFYHTNTVVGQFLTKNQVYDREEYAPLLCEMQKARASGSQPVVQRRLHVKRNLWWGIEEYDTTVIFVYNDHAPTFKSLLPADTQAELAKAKNGAFANYPFYALFFQNLDDPFKLTRPQVNLMAAQAEYAITSHADLFRQHLTGGGATILFGFGAKNAPTQILSFLGISSISAGALVALWRLRRPSVAVSKIPLLG